MKRGITIVRTGGLWTLLLVLAGCGAPSPDQQYETASKAAQAAFTDTAALAQAFDLFAAFVERYPDHEQAASALKTLAMLTQQRGDMEGAVEHYQLLLSRYPTSEQADEAQFMIGFIYEEYVGDLDRARSAYELVIELFPNSDLAANARQLLPHLGQPAEEWVSFQEEVSSPRAD